MYMYVQTTDAVLWLHGWEEPDLSSTLCVWLGIASGSVSVPADI